MECPVCRNPLPVDFTSEPVFCPYCNSDLKGFQAIREIENSGEYRLKRARLYYSAAIVFLLILLTGSLFLHRSKRETTDFINVKQLDSAAFYKNRLSEVQQECLAQMNRVSIKYRVKQGDNLSKIAKLFYGDWTCFRQIISDNNLKEKYRLIPGDTLLIKFKTSGLSY